MWKWTRRLAVGLGAAALVVFGLWVGFVPSIIERMTAAQLEQAGLPTPRLRVRGLSLTHLEMTNLAAGENDRLRIGAVGVDYSPLQLLGKRVEAIEVVGFEAEIRRKDGVWDFGPLANLRMGGEGPTEMPFSQVVLRASTLVLDLDGRRLRVPFRGTVTNAGRDILKIDLTADIEGATLRISGTVNPTSLDFRLTCDGEAPALAPLLAAATPGTAPGPSRAWGGLTVKSTLTRQQDDLSLEAAVASTRFGARLGGHGIVADAVSITVAAKLDKTLRLAALDGSVAAQGMVADGIPVAAVAATLKKGGEAVTLDASAEGTGWKLSRLTARETGLEDWLRGKADLARVAFQWNAVSDNPQILLEATPLKAWTGGKPLAQAALSGDGVLELARAPAGSEAGWTWKVGAPDVRLTLAECGLSLPSAAGNVAGLAAALTLRADADPKHVAVRLMPGSWVSLKSAEVKAGGETVHVGTARLALTEHEQQPLLAVGIEGGRILSVSGALVAETTDPVTTVVGAGATVEVKTIRTVAECGWSEKDAALAGRLVIRGADASLKGKFGDSAVAASVPEAALSVSVRRAGAADSGTDAPLLLDFSVGTPQGVSTTLAGTDVAAGKIEARGTATLVSGAPPAVSARVSLTDASVRHKESGLALAGIAADVPVSWNMTATAEPGRFTVTSIALGGSALPALAGTLGVADTRADFTAAWEPLPGANLRVEGSAATGRRGPSARATLSLPLFTIKDEEALGRLVPSLKGVLVSGTFALDGSVRVTTDGAVPNLALTVLDSTLKSRAWEADAEGVYATVRINRFAPLLTPRKELQVALVRHAKMGKLEVNNGFVAFRIEPKPAEGSPTGWTAYVQHGEWGWAGGRLYVEDLQFDPDAKEHTVTVFARDLKLSDLLALIPDEEATGVGSLDGQLPVTVGTWPNLRFGTGQLRTPPGQSGWFKIKKAEALGPVLDGTDDRFRTDELYMEIKSRLIGAFRNFEYDALNVDFIREGGTFVARVNTKGRARTGIRQEFADVTLNFPDLDQVLRDAILISREVYGTGQTRPRGEGGP